MERKVSRASYLSAHDRQFTLLRSALQLLSDHQASQLTPTDICRETHCVRSLFYRYFPSMDDLFCHLVDYMVSAAQWDYQQWEKDTSSRVTARSTLDSVSKLFVTIAERARPLASAGNSGIALDYIMGCREQLSATIFDDFITGVSSSHRLSIDDLKQTWSVFFTGLLVDLIVHPTVTEHDVMIILARAFHVEAILNEW